MTQHTIYFGNTAVIITANRDWPDATRLYADESMSVSRAKVIKKVETSKYVAIITPNPELTFSLLSREFKWVEAAGGAVEDDLGRLLMIHRRGVWDLPKGHVDSGEEGCEAALREVEEETGIRAEIIGNEPLAVTLHAYNTYGEWELKRTSWWRMRPTGGKLRPQEEEDIARAEWCDTNSVEHNICFSFETIKRVVEALRSKQQ